MPRFVLRYRGKGSYPARTLEKIRAAGGSIVEDAGRLLLVEAPERVLESALALERDWLVTPEVSYARPESSGVDQVANAPLPGGAASLLPALFRFRFDHGNDHDDDRTPAVVSRSEDMKRRADRA